MRLVVAIPLVFLASVLAACSGTIALFALAGVGLAAWIIVAIAAGGLLAFVLRTWYERHRSELPTPGEPEKSAPQINLSSTQVGGNVGGLIFVIGSVLIAAVGLPFLMWFVFAATVGGGIVGWGLTVWHTTHPDRGLPKNRISLW